MGLEALQDIVNSVQDSRSFVEIGRALEAARPSILPGYTLAARTVTVEIVPSGQVVQARVVNVGQGNGKGVFVPVAKGDELVVLFPGGSPLRALAFPGLGNTLGAPNPLGNLGTSILVQHPGGVRLVGADGQPEHGIVHGGLLAALEGFTLALNSFMSSMIAAGSAGAPSAQIAAMVAAATAFAADPAVVEFTAGVSASAASGTAPGVGGPPYATALHKVTP